MRQIHSHPLGNLQWTKPIHEWHCPPTQKEKLINLPYLQNSPNSHTLHIIYIYIYIYYPSKKSIEVSREIGPPFSFLDFNHSEFPLSSSTHRKLFNFLLLKDGVDEDEDDESVVDLSRGRIVTRSCGKTLGCFLLVSSKTSSCINW